MRIRQILTNLAGNAVKFTHEGHVLVKVESMEYSEEDCLLKISVEDTGIGLTEEATKRIFYKFEQADASTSRMFGGTGLGLAICKQLVEMMGGRIEVESVPGKGSSFFLSVRLPIWKSGPAATFPEEFCGLRALVAAENDHLRRMLTDLLGSWGLQCFSPADRFDALDGLWAEPAKEEPPDYLIVDHRIIESRSSLIERLKTDFSFREALFTKTGTILLTTPERIQKAQGCLEQGLVRSYATKPVRASQLTTALLEARINPPGDRPLDKVGPAVEQMDGPDPAKYDVRVLLADDSPVNRKVMGEMLKKLGCRIDTVHNGLRAVERVLAQPDAYDLIFMDCRMPVMGGAEAAAKIKRAHNISTPPTIIAISADASKDDREKCIAAGMDDFLIKPVLTAKLVEVLEQYCGKSTGPEANRYGAVGGEAEPAPASGLVVDADPACEKQVWNYEKVRELSDGDETMVDIYLDSFLKDSPEVLQALCEASREQDMEKLVRLAHTMKGDANTIGAERLGFEASNLELSARENDRSACTEKLSAVRNEHERLCTILKYSVSHRDH